MKQILFTVILFTLLILTPSIAKGQPMPIDVKVQQDTLLYGITSEAIVVTSTKETNSLRSLPAAVSVLSAKRLDAMRIKNLKDLSSFIPNYSVADYGSKMTAPIYIRGIGARSGSQTVGMYVDNIPYFNTTSFDVFFADIQRVEVLRGTQSTLYGRNAMGGLLNIYTYNPLDYQGTNIEIGGGSYGEFSASGSHFAKLSQTLGVSVSAYYKRHDGYYKNDYDNSRVDGLDNAGGRVKLAWKLQPNLTATVSSSFDYVDQGAFPYENKATGKIAFKSDAYYKRRLSTNGLAFRYQGDGFEVNSTTGYQYLNDDMNMDQDYTPDDIYQINQRQNQNSLSQEFTVKSSNRSNYQWSNGVFGFYDYLRTTAPVSMMEGGINSFIQPGINMGMGMMNTMMESMMRKGMQEAGMPPAAIDGIVARAMQAIPDKAELQGEQIVLGGLYRNKTYGGAIFHQSTYNNLFFEGLSATVGLRLDYEKMSLDYLSETNTELKVSGRSSTEATIPSSLLYTGKVSDDYLEFLPKGVLKYSFDPDSYIYGSVSRGYKTGGYNIQMFADILRVELQNRMSGDLTSYMLDLAPKGTVSDELKETILNQFQSGGSNVNDVISYKPEYSWSYEVGGKLDIVKNKLTARFAAYYMDVKDVQVTQFVVTGGGRMVANAGKARSQGVELGVDVRPCSGVYLYANYGFSDAKFRKYHAGVDEKTGKDIDYSGNYIPFAPRMTFSTGASSTYTMKQCTFLDKMTLDVNYAGVGKIYWNEANTHSQGFHGDLNASLTFEKGIFSVNVWGANLLNKKYDTFFFDSANIHKKDTEGNFEKNYFGQVSKPIRFGASLKVSL